MSKLLTPLKTGFGADGASSRALANAAALREWICSQRAAKLAFFGVVSVLAAYLVLLIGAESAAAQVVGQEYQDDAVHRTLENIRNYIISVLLVLGAIGFAAGLGFKGLAMINENMHHASHLAMKGGIYCVVGSALVIPVMEIAQGIAAVGGGGGGS